MSYTLKELSPEEAKKVTEELQAVLAKYDCEMGVTSAINIMKRQEESKEAVLSPIQDVKPDGHDTTTGTDTTTNDTPSS